MLGTAANRLTSSYFGASGAVIGNVGGGESWTLTAAQLPSSIPYSDPGHRHAIQTPRGKLLFDKAFLQMEIFRSFES